ncbi:hemerythrin domain-containing protein [Streptomyces flavidovirens]|uniref:hemerythrin domain-containing protein n=1 Tax=Streptomyces flavidovirens TaxID=67298 RepID=UPI0004133915|nr:hemerythrin domain-containing protein [Streptomyces flavidovirens]
MTRSIAEQSIQELGGEASVLARQRRDHAELDRPMNLYESGSETQDEQRRILKQIVQLTFSHAFAEEVVLWPALRRLAPDGQELTAQVEEEHQEINNLVAEMERMEPQDAGHDQLAGRAFALIRQDIRDEEDLLLPRLQEALDRARLRKLGSAWETVRRTAPTHPHPAVSRRPPGNAVAGVPLSALDRARDLLPVGTRAPNSRRLVLAGCAVLATWLVVTAVRRRH